MSSFWYLNDYLADGEPNKICGSIEQWAKKILMAVDGKTLRQYKRFGASLNCLGGVPPIGRIEHQFIIITLLADGDKGETYFILERDQTGIVGGLSKDYDKLIKQYNNKLSRHGEIYAIDRDLNYLREPYMTIKGFLDILLENDHFTNPLYSLISRNCQHLVHVVLDCITSDHSGWKFLPSQSINSCNHYHDNLAEKFVSDYKKKYGKSLLSKLSIKWTCQPMKNVQLVGPPGSGKTEMALYIVNKLTDRKAVYVDVNLSGIIEVHNKHLRNLVSSRILDKLYLPVESIPKLEPYKQLKQKLQAIRSPIFIALDGIDNIVEDQPTDFRKMLDKLGTNYVHFLIVSSAKLYPASKNSYECLGFSHKVLKQQTSLRFEKNKKKGEVYSKMISKVIEDTYSNHKVKCNPEVFDHFASDFKYKMKHLDLKIYSDILAVTPEDIIKRKYEGLDDDAKTLVQLIAIMCLSWNVFTIDDIKNYVDAVIVRWKAKKKMPKILAEYQSVKKTHVQTSINDNVEFNRDLRDTLKVLGRMSIIKKKYDTSVISDVTSVISNVSRFSVSLSDSDDTTYGIKSSICQYLIKCGDENLIHSLKCDYVFNCFRRMISSPPVKKGRSFVKRKWEAEHAISMAIANTKCDRLNLKIEELQDVMVHIEDIPKLLNNLNDLYCNPEMIKAFAGRIKQEVPNVLRTDDTTDDGENSEADERIDDIDGYSENPELGRPDTITHNQRFIQIQRLLSEVIHPRLLYILHNDQNDSSYFGLPRDPVELNQTLRKEEIKKKIVKKLNDDEHASIYPECRKCRCSSHVRCYNRSFPKCKECISAASKCKCKMGTNSYEYDITLICNLMPLVLKNNIGNRYQCIVSTYVHDVSNLRSMLYHTNPEALEDEPQKLWEERWKSYKETATGEKCGFNELYSRGLHCQLSQEVQGNIAPEEDLSVGASVENDVADEKTSDDNFKYVVNEPCESNLEQYINKHPALDKDCRRNLVKQLLDNMETLLAKSIICCNLNPKTIIVTTDGTLKISIVEEIQESYKRISRYDNIRWIRSGVKDRQDCTISQKDNVYTILMLIFYILFGIHPFDDNGKSSGDQDPELIKLIENQFNSFKEINFTKVKSELLKHM